MSDFTEDETLELGIARFLRAGVLLSGGLMALGWLASLPHADETFTALRTYTPRPLLGEVRGLLANGSWGPLLCYLGLAALVLLPLVRVLLTAVLFARRGERTLMFLAIGVLSALGLSFTLGIDL
jgi:uncharacterized membrane protein